LKDCIFKEINGEIIIENHNVDDNKEIDGDDLQILRCIVYYKNSIIIINPRFEARKRLISYYDVTILLVNMFLLVMIY
jgi:hypothetical protein